MRTEAQVAEANLFTPPLLLLGAFVASPWITSVAATGVILAALYLLWAYQRVFHGPADGDNAEMKDLSLSEGLVLLPMLVLIVFLGVYPKPMLERIEPSIDALIAHVDRNVDDWSEPTADILVPADDGHGEDAEHSEDEELSDGGDDHGEEGE